MNYPTKSILVLGLMSLLAGACKNDEQNVAPTDDNEAITTATLALTNKTTPTDIVTATIENLNTTADFSKATLTLKANTTYTGAISLLDKTKTPALDATEEIREKLNEHLFVYTPSTGLALTITLTDKDTNPAPGPYPVGLTTEIKTGAAGSGKLKVVLRHQPNVKNGTATPGSSDLDTDFNVVIQ
ncbi:hypothetical protein [Spirosoma radiotolerans]|uniref:Type 1 periplasmic binding fold superfamily protein n=1 Tax=Spirosoma radiotolerans TaxID=1379870 RepID=A0A0E3ZU65_9BACT|nr:hypothetical protein [Spirosoma radiotolerans]AKD55423.1 hypothetical protein SD10_11425 [Spirosoma radiotolerans]